MFYSISMELNSLQINAEEVKFLELKYLWSDVAACKPLSLLSVWPAFLLVLPINVSQVNFIWIIVWVLRISDIASNTGVIYNSVLQEVSAPRSGSIFPLSSHSSQQDWDLIYRYYIAVDDFAFRKAIA